MNNILFKSIVGSTAYGTNVPGSDIDYKGIYIQPNFEILTDQYKEQVNVNKDETYYEVKKFLELANTANPTILELFYMPNDCIIQSSAQFDLLKQYRSSFLTKKCKHSFGGYAVQQIQKARGLNKKMNWEQKEMVRKSPLDFCYVMTANGGSELLTEFLRQERMQQEYCGLVALDHIRDGYALYYDTYGALGTSEPLGYKGIVLPDSNDMRLSSVPKRAYVVNFIHYAKDAYTQHCKAYKEYETWLAERNVQRYVDIAGHGQKIDGKNMLHCRRLIDMAMEIAQYGEVIVRRPNAKELIAIRRGEVKLDDILAKAEDDIQKMDELFDVSSLPDDVPQGLKTQLLAEMRFFHDKDKLASIY